MEDGTENHTFRIVLGTETSRKTPQAGYEVVMDVVPPERLIIAQVSRPS